MSMMQVETVLVVVHGSRVPTSMTVLAMDRGVVPVIVMALLMSMGVLVFRCIVRVQVAGASPLPRRQGRLKIRSTWGEFARSIRSFMISISARTSPGGKKGDSWK
jgi:hypothetical protein